MTDWGPRRSDSAWQARLTRITFRRVEATLMCPATLLQPQEMQYTATHSFAVILIKPFSMHACYD